MSKYIAVIDQGTTSSRVIIFDRGHNEVLCLRRKITQYYPKNSWVEHDPLEIISGIKDMFSELSNHLDINDISGVSITNQRETTILWDKRTGVPVYPAIVWQDRRTQGYCLATANEHLNSLVQRKTGLLIDPYFCATKINWILNNVKGVKSVLESDNLLFGTIDSYIIWHLTKGERHVTDITNASRTMLYNIISCNWDNELLEQFKIPPNILPEVIDSDVIAGTTNESVTGVRMPILAVLGDQQAAAIGQGCVSRGDIKCTLGTGSFIVLNTGKDVIYSRHKLISTVAFKVDGVPYYALEGSIFMAGAIMQWLRDKLELISDSKESEVMASSLTGNKGVYMVPAFTGLGAPYWIPSAKASIVGMTRDTGKAEVVRAGLEAVAYQVNDILKLMKIDANLNYSKLLLDGGMSCNDWLLQFMSNILNTDIDRAEIIEATAYGAMLMGAVNCGWEPDLSMASNKRKSDRVFSSKMDASSRSKLEQEWTSAVDMTILNCDQTTVELV